MNRSVRTSVVALALCGFSLVGCETKRIWLQVTGFDDGVVTGIWLWRLSEETGSYERACRFPFAETDEPANLERLAYVQECGDGSENLEFSVPIRRSPSQPDTVTVGLWYLNRYGGAATYKISSYGLYGETSLSDTAIQL